MNFTLYKLKTKAKRKLVDAWYRMMKPLVYFFTPEKEKKRYERKRSKITERHAVTWIAEDIIRYVIKHKTTVDILICDYASDDQFWNYCTLSSKCPYYIKRAKTKMAYYKFKIDVAFQEKVIDCIKATSAVKVTEEVEKFTWQRIDNYKKTVIISL